MMVLNHANNGYDFFALLDVGRLMLTNCDCLADLKLCQDDMLYADVQVLGSMCK